MCQLKLWQIKVNEESLSEPENMREGVVITSTPQKVLWGICSIALLGIWKDKRAVKNHHVIIICKSNEILYILNFNKCKLIDLF